MDLFKYYNNIEELYGYNKSYMIDKDAAKSSYLNGKLHNEDGPAVELISGYEEWYLHGKRHNEDGPAIEYPDGSKSWWLNGVKYSEEDWKQKVKDL